MHGKTHKEIETLRPLKDGVIADFQASEQMIRGFIKRLNFKGGIFSPALKWSFVYLLVLQKLKKEL